MLLFGPLYNKYANPSVFLNSFARNASVVGGIFIQDSAHPDLLISRSKLDNKLYIFENFSLPRRSKNFMPVCVYEVEDSVLEEVLYRTIAVDRELLLVR